MAAGTILTVLSNIPWGTVVENAPKVADGAAKLWSTVTRWNKSDAAQNDKIAATSDKLPSETELLASRMHTVEESIRHLNEQMQASSALIKDLAEQNTLLIQRIELNRLRLVRVMAGAASTGIVLLGMNFYLFFTR